jgi:uncharacterized membrane protein YdjX (TVP38/TMEM64 family)
MSENASQPRSNRTKDVAVDKPSGGKPGRKLLLLALVSAAAAVGYWAIGDRLSFDYLATQEATFRDYLRQQPVMVSILALAVYVVVTGFSIPGASVLTLAYGWYFGFWQALWIVSFGSTAGATLAFLMIRYFFHDWVQQRFAGRLQSVSATLEREGAFYLFTLRLLPAVPFFVINALMGLTNIRARTFWWVSQLGMLPGTAAYVYAGASVPSLHRFAEEGVQSILSWQLLVAFTILGLLPLGLKKAVVALGQQ